jgi:hypothetical protein
VVTDAIPSLSIFGITPKFIKSECAIRAGKNIDTNCFAIKIDRSNDLIDMSQNATPLIQLVSREASWMALIGF